MGSFSGFHLIIVMMVLLIPVGVAAIAVRSNTDLDRLNRKAFILRVVAAIFISAMVAATLNRSVPEGAASAISLLVGLALVAFIASWAVARLRDMGNGRKSLAVITAIPLVGFFYVIYLMIAPSKSVAEVH